ncbi:MAG: DsbA family protein [Alphaproteobacteria bacterium]|nr:DsbA family protein [Alphaproteobacteria bacterium]
MRIFTALLTILVFAFGAAAKEQPKFERVDSAMLSHAPYSDDFSEGQHNAPVVFIEYASLSCPHCAHFHKEIYPVLKKNYIDTGKMVYILRPFPLNEPALKAATLVDCIGEQSGAQRYYTFVRVLFDAQDKWALDMNFLSALETFAKVGGVPKETFEKCVSDPARELKLLKEKQAAAKELGVSGTPYIFINGRHYDDEFTLPKVTAYIDRLLAQPSKANVPAPATPEK